MTITEEALVSRATERPTVRLDFADVYREHLSPVWRYVRSRVRDHHEAQDVTSEVFARAFRSWIRFDVDRGEVAPWLFRIAQRTVVDWLRRRRAELPDPEGVAAAPDPGEGPEAKLVHGEDLERLGRALQELTGRERDAIALRFAGDLKFAEIGEILDLSTPAAKMVVWRAIGKLRAMFFSEEAAEVGRAPAGQSGVPGAGGVGESDAKMAELLHALAVVHDFDVPPELPDRIAACVRCSARVQTGGRRPGGGGGEGSDGSDRGRSPDGERTSADDRAREDERLPGTARSRAIARHLGFVPFVGFGWGLIAPACLVCVGGTLPLLGGFGVAGIAGLSMHSVALAIAPLVLIPLWLNYRRHRKREGILLGVIGALGILIHSLGHLGAWPATVLAPFDYGPAWEYGLRIGIWLLFAGAVVNALAMALWVSRQWNGLAAALAAGWPVPRPAGVLRGR